MTWKMWLHNRWVGFLDFTFGIKRFRYVTRIVVEGEDQYGRSVKEEFDI